MLTEVARPKRTHAEYAELYRNYEREWRIVGAEELANVFRDAAETHEFYAKGKHHENRRN